MLENGDPRYNDNSKQTLKSTKSQTHRVERFPVNYDFHGVHSSAYDLPPFQGNWHATSRLKRNVYVQLSNIDKYFLISTRESWQSAMSDGERNCQLG
jgi:hypothetical protein